MKLVSKERSMKAIIYTRVSTKEQFVMGLSPENQEKACSAFALSNGYGVEKVFIEEGESAKTANRTQLLELFGYCSKNKGKIDALIVWKLDRLARSAEDHFMIKAMLLKFGVKLMSATEPIDDSPSGKLMETVLAGFAQFDNDVRTVRVSIGMQSRVKQGRWVWSAPLGYKNASDGAGPILIKDELRADLIKHLFEEFSKGIYSQKEICYMANGLGLRTKAGKFISQQTMHKILSNKVYAGYICSSMVAEDVKGLHDALITEQIFYQCQDIISGKKSIANIRSVNNPAFPLRGLLRCADCGSKLTGSFSSGKSKKYGYYHCTSCKGGPNIPIAAIHSKFEELLEAIQPDLETMNLFSMIVKDIWEKELSSAVDMQRKSQIKLDSLEDRKKALVDAYVTRRIGQEEYDSVLESLKLEIVVQTINLNEHKFDTKEIEAVLDFANDYLVNTRKLWATADFSQKQKFQQLIFPQGITCDKKEIVGTPVLSPCYAVLGSSRADKSTMVVPRGFEPLLPG